MGGVSSATLTYMGIRAKKDALMDTQGNEKTAKKTLEYKFKAALKGKAGAFLKGKAIDKGVDSLFKGL